MSKVQTIDIDELHELFMLGKKLSEIACRFKVSESHIQKLISKERKLNPDKWPKRKKQTTEFDFYYCGECGNAFAVEECEDPKVCPCCKSDLWEYSHSLAVPF